MIRALPKRYIPFIATAAVFFLLYGFGVMHFGEKFGSLRNIVNLVGDNAFLGIAAVGATFVILSGGIDLSSGSVVAFTSVLVATLMQRYGGEGADGLLAAGVIAISLLVGAILGLTMGALITVYDIPPFMATLGGMFFARGMAFVLQPEGSIGIRGEFFSTTICDDWAIQLTERVYFPFWGICFLIVLLLGFIVLQRTRLGRSVYAIGDNETSAKLMGLPCRRTKLWIYTIAGLCSAMAGVVYAFYTQSGDPNAAVGLELDVIASVVIGGTVLSGGSGYVLGTLFGVLILGLIQTLISFQGTLNSWWTKIFVGFLLLAFILLQRVFASVAKSK